MHKYYWDVAELTDDLKPFIGGQCQVHSKSPDAIYRGAVNSFEVCSQRLVVITFDWLRTEVFIPDDYGILRPWWVLIPPPPKGLPFLNFRYYVYYPQKDEDRVKLKGYGEICHFFKPDDFTNLVQQGEEFVPEYKTFNKKLFKANILNLLIKAKSKK